MEIQKRLSKIVIKLEWSPSDKKITNTPLKIRVKRALILKNGMRSTPIRKRYIFLENICIDKKNTTPSVVKIGVG